MAAAMRKMIWIAASFKKAPVAPDHQRFALNAVDPVKNGLNIVFQIARFHEHARLLAQATCAMVFARQSVQ